MPEVVDAVCGMTFDEETADELGAVVVEHAGKKRYFCCETCAAEFRSAPDKFA